MDASTVPLEAGANGSNCSAAWMRPEQDTPPAKVEHSSTLASFSLGSQR